MKGGLIMEIEHNTYFDGGVQSLAFVKGGKATMSVGLVMPGEHDFGEVKRMEVIQVTSGALGINGELYRSEDGPCVVNPGERVMMHAKDPSSYTCIYG
jgi:uncharacterized protein YaiE (UPF0345 family)